ncbi:MAG: hypothetical protein L0I24_25730, partial [Pseudonocardia sp.]|nr:hypothetical protein [Pseudonocardia sp.]
MPPTITTPVLPSSAAGTDRSSSSGVRRPATSRTRPTSAAPAAVPAATVVTSCPTTSSPPS